jgi:SAM-dependent methyltransferase
MECNYPIFDKTANYLKNKAPFFRKTIPNQINTNFNFELAERLCKTGLSICDNNWDDYFKKLNNLIDMSIDFLKLQIKLEKTGKYFYSSFEEVEKYVYSENELDEGPNYLWGLYFSEIFWKIHHNFVNFFLDEFVQSKEEGSFLEIPSGTGFFLCEFLRKNPNWDGVGVDIATASIKFSETLLQKNNIPKKSYKIIKEDFLKFDESKKFDKISCGEFLEHLEDPVKALNKFHRLLKKDGELFITVAVWAAHIDHIYLYDSAQQVRNHIETAGFNIKKELVQSVFEKDENYPEKEKIPVSYAAILTKK